MAEISAGLLHAAALRLRQKQAVVSPSEMGMMGPAAGMDPAAAGMDPAAAQQQQAAPQQDPLATLAPMVQQLVQQQLMSQAGGAAGAGAAGAGQLKPKIDVNVEIMQIKNMLAKISDALGIHIPAQEMVATPDKLTAMSQGADPAAAQQQPQPGGDPTGGGAISPIQPIPAAQKMAEQDWMDGGEVYDDFFATPEYPAVPNAGQQLTSLAGSVARMMRK